MDSDPLKLCSLHQHTAVNQTLLHNVYMASAAVWHPGHPATMVGNHMMCLVHLKQYISNTLAKSSLHLVSVVH